MTNEMPSLNDPRVRAVWEAFKAEGWIFDSLKQARIAVATLDAMDPMPSRPGYIR